MMRSVFLAAVLSAMIHSAGAQVSPRVIQVSGVVMVSDSLFPAPYVSVVRARDHRGTYTDRDGYFTLPVIAGDTLEFVCTGLVPSFFVIPGASRDFHLSMVQVMDMDSVTLPTVYILPYPAPHRLKKELLALDLPGDQYRAFTREVTSITSYDGMVDFSGRSYREAAAVLNARYSGGFQSGGNLLNPSAWSTFIRSIRSDDANGRR
jgi:hypothetical protein